VGDDDGGCWNCLCKERRERTGKKGKKKMKKLDKTEI